MSIPSIPDPQHLQTLEQKAEQMALAVLRGITFTDCLKFSGLAPAHEIVTPEGKTITIRGSNIYDSRTWKKFLISIGQGEDIYQLTGVREHLSEQYKIWLLHKHTTRYHTLSSEADLAWFERVVILAVTRHIMEKKYEGYTSRGLETFADPRTAIEMSKLLMLNAIVKEAARVVHHVIKEPAQAHHLIELFYEENYRQMQARSLLIQEILLPSEVTPPLALQTQEESENHE